MKIQNLFDSYVNKRVLVSTREGDLIAILLGFNGADLRLRSFKSRSDEYRVRVSGVTDVDLWDDVKEQYL